MLEKTAAVIKPKVFIIGMFGPEADIWYGIPKSSLNVSGIGLSPFYSRTFTARRMALFVKLSLESPKSTLLAA
jgi:hypothetical protein